MKNVLIIYFSQTGQLLNILESVAAPLISNTGIHVRFISIKPLVPYPYPWDLISFLDTMPVAVLSEKIPLNPISYPHDDPYDLIILGYQPWYLSISPPVSSFLQSKEAKIIFKDKPVITVIGCRGMWLMAHEKMKMFLLELKATLIDNIVLVDQGGGISSLFTTPNWLLRGKKKGMAGIIPPAGISEKDIENAARFGKAISEELEKGNEKSGKPMLKGLGAVNVDEKMIFPEFVFKKIFTGWAKQINAVSRFGSVMRKAACLAFGCFLVFSAILFLSIGFLIGPLMHLIFKAKVKWYKSYFEQPSGSDFHPL